jgi:hypothetical protein
VDFTEAGIKGCKVVPIKPSEIDYGIQLRLGDFKEIQASGYKTREIALYASVEGSEEAYAALIDDRQEALFGVSNTGLIWFVSTDRFFEVCKEDFKEVSKKLLYEWQTKYYILHNHVLAENDRSIKWLESLGFRTCDIPGKAWKYFWRY